MDLSVYDVIRGPWVSTKAHQLNQDLQQLVLEVHLHANKPMVREALRKLFNVEPRKIRIMRVPRKRKRFGQHISFTKERKKAIVTLKEGYSTDQFAHPDEAVAESQESASQETQAS